MSDSAEIRDSIFSKIFERLERLNGINSDTDKSIEKMTLEVRDLAMAVNSMRKDLNVLVATLRGLGATASLMGTGPPFQSPRRD